MNMVDQHVKAIYLLQGMENGPAAIGALASMMEASPVSADEMIGKLESRGPTEREKYKGVILTNGGIIHARDVFQTYCTTEHFLSNVLDVEEFRTEARELKPVIDGMTAERFDTIIDRSSEYPDCFDPEADACEYLDACGAEPETETEAAD